MLDTQASASSDAIHIAASPEQPNLARCAECRGVDFDFLQAHPGSRRKVRVHKDSDCEFCRFLLASLVRPGTVYNSELAQDIVVDINISSDAGQSTFFCAGRLFVSICYNPILEDGSVLLRLEPSGNLQGGTSSFRSIDPRSIDYELLRSWIYDCHQSHAGPCLHTHVRSNTYSDDVPGFKVIDCLDRTVKEQIISNISYIALSYVWGQPPCKSARVERRNIAKDGKLPRNLPATIADAIAVTMKLGFRYLWVDKYCIDQSNTGEVRLQISMMDIIYHAASVTIIAAAGRDSHHGLPGVGMRPRTVQNTITMKQVDWVSTSVDLKKLVAGSHWHTRGWTYQEAFFAKARLIFTEEQVIFECNRDSSCEQEPGAERRSEIGYLPRFSYDAKDLLDHIRAYASRDLTHQGDILNGMKGIFRFFATGIIPEQQYWGLPISIVSYRHIASYQEFPIKKALTTAIFIGLAWSRWSSTMYEPCGDGKRRQGFPSWSWCGWNASPVWEKFEKEDEDSMSFMPQDIHVQRLSGSTLPLTEKLAAGLLEDHSDSPSFTYHLHMRAEVLDVRIAYLEEGIEFPFASYREMTRYAAKVSRDASVQDRDCEYPERLIHLWPMEPTPHMDEHHELHAMLCNQTLQCIMVANPHGLLVYTTEMGACERIGLIQVRAANDPDPYTEDTVHDGPHLREYFPGSIRDIVLG